MKRLVILSALFFYLAGCSKSEKDSSVNFNKIDEITRLKPYSEQSIVAFNLLSEKEKAFIWEKHIKDLTSQFRLTKPQQIVVEKALEIISPEMYYLDKKDEYAGIISKWEYEARNVFSKKDFFLIFELLNSNVTMLSQGNFPVVQTTLPGGGGTCTCRTDYWCHGQTGNDTSWCQWNDQDPSVCETSNGGCGPFGLLNCRGICINPGGGGGGS
jgi:hypothetical protein